MYICDCVDQRLLTYKVFLGCHLLLSYTLLSHVQCQISSLSVVHLFEVVQPISVTVWKFEPIQVLQRASVVLRGHFGDLL